MDSLGDRMKMYEKVYKNKLSPKGYFIARVDGRSFHSFTRNLNKPFDDNLIKSFIYSMKNTAKEIQGFICAYHQSDEVSFLFTDTNHEDSQIWFDGKIDKINSVTASLFTYHFNYSFWYESNRPEMRPAVFDCRCFSVPKEDVSNYFLWRMKDYHRNSINMQASQYFSHSFLMGKNSNSKLDLLADEGQSWEDLSPVEKYGSFYINDYCYHDSFNYQTLNHYIFPGEE